MTLYTAITVSVPGMLREYCRGAARLEVDAASVRDALAALEQEHGALYRNVCDETGAVRRHVNLFVNSDNIRDRGGLDTPLSPGDLLTILPAVSGG